MISLYLFIYFYYIIIVQMDEVLRSSGLNYAFQGIILTWMSFLKKVLLFYLKNDYLFLIFIFKRGVDVFFKYIYIYIYSYDNIAKMDEDFIVNETHQSDSRNYIELNESSNDEKNNDMCGEKVLEEYNFEPFVGQCFQMKKRYLVNC